MDKIIEVKRKLAHILLGIALVVLLSFNIINKMHLFYLIMIGIILSFLSRKLRIPLIYWFLQKLEKKEHLSKFPGKGVIFYFIGAFFAVSFFPSDIALASISILAFADPTSYIFGMKFGKIPHPFTDKKFLEGMIFGIIAGFIGALIFVPWYEAIAASFFAMLAEGIEIKAGLEEVDDNIVIPLVAAVVIWAIRLLL